MFDSVLRPDFSQNRFGAGVFIAVAAHVLVVTVALMLSRPDRKIVIPSPVWPGPVVIPMPAPLGHAERTEKPPVESHRTRPRDLSRPARVMPTALPKPEPSDVGISDGPEPGLVVGRPDGIEGGFPTDSAPVTVPPRPPARIELDEGDVRLKKISGPDPEYTRQALDHEVEGTIVTKCVVTPYGLVERCRILKSLPFMDRSVIDALERRRYEPYRINGTPVEVDYIFRIKLQLPR